MSIDVALAGKARSVPRERTFSWEDPLPAAAAAARLPGLEALQRIASGDLPAPPISRLIGMTIVSVEHGRAVFAFEPAEWMYNPIGSVHGGVIATILDSCTGCAVHTTLPAGVGYATSDLQVRYLAGLAAGHGRVVAEGTVIHAGRRTATAEGRLVRESDGRLIAHATTGCTILRPE